MASLKHGLVLVTLLASPLGLGCDAGLMTTVADGGRADVATDAVLRDAGSDDAVPLDGAARDVGAGSDVPLGTDAPADTPAGTDVLPMDAGVDAGIVGESGVAPFGPRATIYDDAATGVDWGDFDGDGDLDLFVVEGGRHSGGSQILAWFEAPSWERHNLGGTIGPFTGDCAAEDVDADGDLDIVTAYDRHSGGTGRSAVVWYENDDPLGTWEQHVIEAEVPGAFHIGDLKTGDVDGDGRLDVVVRHLSTLRFVVYFQNAGDSWTAKRIETRHREGLFVTDVDGDGRADVIGNGFVLFAPSDPRVEDFVEVTIDRDFYGLPMSGLNNSTKAATADFSGDGRADILFSVAEGAAVRLAWYEAPASPRTGTWTRHVIEEPLRNMHQAEIFDIDLDGDLDVIGGYAFGQSGVVWWENGDGSGTSWTKHTIDGSGGCYSCEAADFDRDGDIDLAGPQTYTGQVRLYENLTVP